VNRTKPVGVMFRLDELIYLDESTSRNKFFSREMRNQYSSFTT
jgi:hypothetical protein